ncbi:hypothetical protein [Spirillospora sp. CA-294931]|uniref:hypothetical protein n=1 Tax=Spirillospora sp. CA-294931 TaxID=3240042 RepID=UPI003D8D0536
MRIFEVSGDVHALIEDLLPVVNPAARFEAELARVVLPVGRFAPSASTWVILERCAREPRPAWPRLVEDWLREVGDRAAMAIADIELLGDVRELLRLRIVPKLTDTAKAGLVVLPVGEHFDAMVMIDHPRFGGPLTEARASLLALRRLGDLVVRNTHQRELADVTSHDQPLTLDEQVRVVTKPGSRYVSALLTELDRFLPDAGPTGVLLAVPSHSTILLYTITSAGMSQVLPVFMQLAQDMHAAADDPCTPETFWWRRDHPMIKLHPAADPPPPPQKRRRPWRRS